MQIFVILFSLLKSIFCCQEGVFAMLLFVPFNVSIGKLVQSEITCRVHAVGHDPCANYSEVDCKLTEAVTRRFGLTVAEVNPPAKSTSGRFFRIYPIGRVKPLADMWTKFFTRHELVTFFGKTFLLNIFCLLRICKLCCPILVLTEYFRHVLYPFLPFPPFLEVF